MFHNIGEHTYHCEYLPQAPDPDTDYLLCYRESELLFSGDTLPRLREVSDLCAEESLQFLFSVSGISFFLPRSPLPERDTLHYAPVQTLRRFAPDWLAFAGVTGYHLADWYRSNRFCGHCGCENVHKSDERALVCPHCGQIRYPIISVAVIVAILDGDRILLTRYAGRTSGNYALIAGFVEIGESLEDTVRREVMEEVGLKVKNIRYYSNQPWGFSQSLLVGFFADLDGSPAITLQESELSEATWIAREDVPESDSLVSLTATMMTAFRKGENTDLPKGE